MPRKPDKTSLIVAMTKEELEAVHSFARKQGHAVTSDYIRALIERDMGSNGVDFKFDVDRGGYRKK